MALHELGVVMDITFKLVLGYVLTLLVLGLWRIFGPDYGLWPF